MKKTFTIQTGFIVVLTFAVAILCFAAFKAKPQPAENKYITLSLWEPQNGFFKTEMVVTYEDGKSEESELPRLTNAKQMEENNQQVTQMLNKLYGQGYRIVCVTSRIQGLLTTYTLQKN